MKHFLGLFLFVALVACSNDKDKDKDKDKDSGDLELQSQSLNQGLPLGQFTGPMYREEGNKTKKALAQVSISKIGSKYKIIEQLSGAMAAGPTTAILDYQDPTHIKWLDENSKQIGECACNTATCACEATEENKSLQRTFQLDDSSLIIFSRVRSGGNVIRDRFELRATSGSGIL